MAELVNIRLVEAQYAALMARDLQQVLAYYAPDAVREDITHPGPSTGRDQIAHHYQALLGAFPDLEVRIERLVATDAVVMTELVFAGTHQGHFHGLAATGRRAEVRLVEVKEVRDRQVRWERCYQDAAAWARQLGGADGQPGTTAAARNAYAIP